jgi:hypothetical protein
MNDKELLEFAAKAAGFEVVFYGNECVGVGISDVKRDWPWNPLTDDGDALRLAVKLGLLIDTSTGRDIHVQYPIGDAYYPLSEDDETDPYAATRRAIVRAAAEIGKSL